MTVSSSEQQGVGSMYSTVSHQPLAANRNLSSVTRHLFSQLRPQRHHRIQLGGLAGRIDAEEDARGRGHEQAQQHAPQLHAGGETYDERYQLGHGHSAEYADDSPHQRP